MTERVDLPIPTQIHPLPWHSMTSKPFEKFRHVADSRWSIVGVLPILRGAVGRVELDLATVGVPRLWFSVGLPVVASRRTTSPLLAPGRCTVAEDRTQDLQAGEPGVMTQID